ncbi:hypothetical protein [Actinomadura madurae]|uniref:hypothetical protein n=1 Tax=Actinomadura madurae TaxID=1993 RepID=UPI0020D238ED|nr:hypothetical protein [Actinomadura madurae]MCP9947194.1 hypothetical protein [Actinomadura madurae]MCP9963960.1 hypothetical protein [Actinomadura madurae]MCP9976434.1 hypothetical protein [Actinomadura madurae]MCQ0012073.1 hypothetical protein [Actinomadura madurae]MCQ0012627.1 hypothetical protein [Actinomadura madurae]
MTSSEEQHARHLAGTHNQDALEKIARFLHANESIHMHQRIEDKEPCEYCWLRAGKALAALRQAGLPVVLGPDPVIADEPVEVEAEVLHALEAAGSVGDRAEVQGWRIVHISAPGADWTRRTLVFRSQDGRHYGVPFTEFMQADPAARIVCHPAVPKPVVTQTCQYELAEAAAR